MVWIHFTCESIDSMEIKSLLNMLMALHRKFGGLRYVFEDFVKQIKFRSHNLGQECACNFAAPTRLLVKSRQHVRNKARQMSHNKTRFMLFLSVVQHLVQDRDAFSRFSDALSLSRCFSTHSSFCPAMFPAAIE